MSFMKPVVAACAVASIAMSLAATGAHAAGKSGTEAEANKATMLQFYDLVNAGDVDAVAALMTPDFVDHQIMPGMPGGVEGVKQMMKMLTTTFPDFHFKVEDTMSSGDKVVCRTTMTGTMKGPWMGMPPTGMSFTIGGIDIVRFANGKAVEHWGNEDDMGMMMQLGLAPSMGGMPAASASMAPASK